MTPSNLDDHEKDLAAQTAEAKTVLVEIQDYPITSQEDTKVFSGLLQDVKGRWKDIEAKRKSLTDPLNTVLKRINEMFSPPLTALKSAEVAIKSKLAAAEAEARQRAQQALLAASEAAASADAEAVTEAIEAHDTAVQIPQAEGLQYRQLWTFEIENESLIPREFLIPDVRALKALATAQKERASVPGVKFISQTSVVSRA